MRALGVDPGSAKLGLVSATVEGAALSSIAAATLAVDPARLEHTMATIETLALGNGADVGPVKAVVVEWAEHPYSPPPPKIKAGMDQRTIDRMQKAYAAKLASIGRAREVMTAILTRIRTFCEARSIPLHTINTSTWRGRIGVAKRSADASTDQLVWDALLRVLGRGTVKGKIHNEHEADACGALLGWAIGAPRGGSARAPATCGESGVSRVVSVVRALLASLGRPPVTNEIAEALVLKRDAWGCKDALRFALASGELVRPAHPRCAYAPAGWVGQRAPPKVKRSVPVKRAVLLALADGPLHAHEIARRIEATKMAVAVALTRSKLTERTGKRGVWRLVSQASASNASPCSHLASTASDSSSDRITP